MCIMYILGITEYTNSIIVILYYIFYKLLCLLTLTWNAIRYYNL